jgi:hypothetical protein
MMLLLLTAAGCTTDSWVREEKFNNDNLEVYLEHRLKENAVVSQGFEHPFSMSVDDIAAILSSLLYWDSTFLGKKVKEPVFNADEVASLAPALAGALGEAGPDERVAFISQNWGGGAIFSNRRITRGAAFVEPGGILNLAFIEINEEFTPTDYSQMGRERTEKEPTAVTRSGRPLVAFPWLSLRPVEGTDEVHPLWGVINTGSIKEALAILREGAAGSAQPAEGSPEAAAPPPESMKTISGVKEKLKLLKELFDEGLITEEEYKQKKAQLLEKL